MSTPDPSQPRPPADPRTSPTSRSPAAALAPPANAASGAHSGSSSPDAPALGDLALDDFRAAGHLLVDWIANHWATAEERPVLAAVRPGELRAALPAAAPEGPSEFASTLAEFERVLVPGLTQWGHGRYFAYFPCGFSLPGALADFLSTAVSQQAMLWRTSPAATELEEVTLGWLRDAMGLPATWEGVIYDTASTGIVHALAAAREARVAGIRTSGWAGSGAPRCRIYTGEHAHSSVDKAAITLGFGLASVRRIPAADDGGMRPDLLAAAVAEDREAGWLPLAVVATVGTTAAGSADPVAAVAELCAREDLWLHVDAAYAGPTLLLPEHRGPFTGVERADSLIVNPHKWLWVPFDCSLLYSPRLDLLRQAFALTPEYLRTAETGQVKNLMDTGFQLGRRFRALKLWTVLRTFGLEGLRARLREHLRLAHELAGWVDADPHFTRAAPVGFSVVCLRATPPHLAGDGEREDAFNERLLAAVNASGEAFLSHARLAGRIVLRVAIGNLRTSASDIAHLWALLRQKAAELAADDR
jgi:aromatic-L-amino-acid decarboxylase